MKQQQRMKIMNDLTKKIRSKGRVDAENRWRVAELVAESVDNGKHYSEVVCVVREDEKNGTDGGEAPTKSGANDQECGGKRWTLAQNHKAYSMERRNTDPEERRICKVVRPL